MKFKNSDHDKILPNLDCIGEEYMRDVEEIEFVDGVATHPYAAKYATNQIVDTVTDIAERIGDIASSIGSISSAINKSRPDLKSNPEVSKADMKKLYQEFTVKLEAYRADKIYTYLKGKYYGTPKYRGTGLNKNMDSMLAGWCHFNENFRQESLIIEVMTRLEDMGVVL